MIQILTEGLPDEGMPEQMLMETLHLVRRHPWWRARAKLALMVLKQQCVHAPATVVDLGCGWGVTLNALEATGYQTIGVDVSREILQQIDTPTRHLVQADLRKPLAGLSVQADALLLLDVIEHVDDDHQVVHHCSQLLRPGGLAVVSVPARPDLFSEFDQIQGHRRRYLPERLRFAFENTGLKLRQVFWWGQWMVPLLRRRGRTSGHNGENSAKTYSDYLRLPPWPGPLMMNLLYSWEAARAISGKLKTGTSLFAIAFREG